MPENTQPAPHETMKSKNETPTTLHTCACGETHEHHEDGISHRDECTSTRKFGNSCCCTSDMDPKGNQHRCGHGPRCR
ncbi:hypothetical protein [uncultured Methanoregula sp.]|uniref:hypothetical protein n=1 Tax=uncultured Methanoregula sp. TaxID=1005933 RepID=UPI0037482DF4